jgi:hypothetical protein
VEGGKGWMWHKRLASSREYGRPVLLCLQGLVDEAMR